MDSQLNNLSDHLKQPLNFDSTEPSDNPYRRKLSEDIALAVKNSKLIADPQFSDRVLKVVGLIASTHNQHP